MHARKRVSMSVGWFDLVKAYSSYDWECLFKGAQFIFLYLILG